MKKKKSLSEQFVDHLRKKPKPKEKKTKPIKKSNSITNKFLENYEFVKPGLYFTTQIRFV